MGTLLTFPGRPLPLVPPGKESAAEVLLPVSASNVVVVGDDPPPLEPPAPGPEVAGGAALECWPDPHASDAIASRTTATNESAYEDMRYTGPPGVHWPGVLNARRSQRPAQR